MWEHSPLFSGLGAASIAAGRCISAGAPSRPLTRVRFCSFCLSRVSCVCTPSSFSPKKLKSVRLVLGFVFRFCCSPFGRALRVVMSLLSRPSFFLVFAKVSNVPKTRTKCGGSYYSSTCFMRLQRSCIRSNRQNRRCARRASA